MDLRTAIRMQAKQTQSNETTESERVLGLPVVTYSGEGVTELLRKAPGIGDLKQIQTQALEAIAIENGGIFPIGVGHGKTLIALLAGTVVDADRVVILAPSQTLENLAAEKERFSGIFHIPQSVKLLAYEILSREKGEAQLRSYLGAVGEKVIVICDEAHKLKRKDASRTRRIIDIGLTRPDVSWVFLSGTITSRSLYDFAHLVFLALRERSPLPIDKHHLAAWAECIDVSGQPGPMQWSFVYELWRRFGPLSKPNLAGASELEAKDRFEVGDKGLFNSLPHKLRRDQVRYSFQARLHTAPGVVATSDASIKISLYIHALSEKDIPVSPAIKEALDNAKNNGLRPDGALIGDPKDLAVVQRYLSAGFYYKWVWPNDQIDQEWWDSQKEWNRQLRAELLYKARSGYDSELLVRKQIKKEIASGGKLRAIHQAWLWWSQHMHKPAPPTVAVWIDYSFIDWCVNWLWKSEETAMLWYSSQAVEKELVRRGVTVYGAGLNPVPTRATRAHRMAAVMAHGTGKNMHQWQSALVMEPFPDAVQWQQVFARLHRPECEHDEIDFSIPMHTQPLRDTMRKAMERANYEEKTAGESQRLNLATWLGLRNQQK